MWEIVVNAVEKCSIHMSVERNTVQNNCCWKVQRSATVVWRTRDRSLTNIIRKYQLKSVGRVRKHETQSYRESCVFHFSYFELYIHTYIHTYIPLCACEIFNSDILFTSTFITLVKSVQTSHQPTRAQSEKTM